MRGGNQIPMDEEYKEKMETVLEKSLRHRKIFPMKMENKVLENRNVMIYYASETCRSMCAVLKMVRDKEVIPEGMGVTFCLFSIFGICIRFDHALEERKQ